MEQIRWEQQKKEREDAKKERIARDTRDNRVIGTTTTAETSTPSTPTVPLVERHDIICGGDSITAVVPSNLFPGSPHVTWSDPSCGVQTNGSHYIDAIGFHDCGTTVQFTHDTVIFENTLTGQSTQTISPVVDFGETSTYSIPVRCVYPRRENLTSSFFPIKQNVRVFEKRYGHLDLQMGQFDSDQYDQPLTTQQIPVGGDIYIKLTVDHLNRSDLAVKADNCVATPSMSAADSIYFRLLQDGCAASGSMVHVYPSSYNEVKFRMKAFMFRSAAPGLVYIHCEVSVCAASSTECNTGCTTRRKREVAQGQSSHLLSTGPILLVADEGSSASTIAAAVCAAVAVIAIGLAVIGWRRRRPIKFEESTVQ